MTSRCSRRLCWPACFPPITHVGLFEQSAGAGPSIHLRMSQPLAGLTAPHPLAPNGFVGRSTPVGHVHDQRCAAPGVALLGPQTAGILLRNIRFMYRRHFGVLITCCVVPMVPWLLLFLWHLAGNSQWAGLSFLFDMVAGFFAGGTMTVVISDICLGNRPTLMHAYRRVFGRDRWLHMLATGFLFSVMVRGGMLLLLLPGLWVLARGFFSSVVVMLEGRSARDAIKRSFANGARPTTCMRWQKT